MRGVIKSILILLLSIPWLPVFSQTYLGISANVGNRLRYNPPSTGLRRAVALSGNLTIRVQEKTRNNWVAQYGADIGVLGYNLKIAFIDTLHTGYWPPDYKLDYSTLYGNFHLLIGKEFMIQEKGLMVGAGGGITRYYSLFGASTFSIHYAPSDSQGVYELFSSTMSDPLTQTSAYIKIAAQLRLNKYISLGLEYSSHIKKVLDGTYQFYHTRTPSAGDISLYQRELQIIFLVNVSKKRSVN